MTLLDHVFVILFAVVYPLAGALGFQRLLRRIRSGSSVNRTELYRYSMLGHWMLLAIGLIVWTIAGRPWPALGLDLVVDSRFLLGAVLTLACIALFVVQLRQNSAGNNTHEPASEIFHERIGKLAPLIPRSTSELAHFYGLSVTAGIVEEILWRGFLIWYLGQYLPLAAAASISAAGFGLAHAYQGWRQVPAIVLVGFAFAGLYVLTGSVWLPIVLHGAVDILQGRLGYELWRRSETAARVAATEPSS